MIILALPSRGTAEAEADGTRSGAAARPPPERRGDEKRQRRRGWLANRYAASSVLIFQEAPLRRLARPARRLGGSWQGGVGGS